MTWFDFEDLEPIDQDKAAAFLQSAPLRLVLSEPERIIFCDPYEPLIFSRVTAPGPGQAWEIQAPSWLSLKDGKLRINHRRYWFSRIKRLLRRKGNTNARQD